MATVSGLQQGYVICPAEQRFLLLFTFLKKNKDKKVMVFFSSCMSVRFHDELFNYIDLPTTCIHGKKKQAARMSTYYEFCEAEVCAVVMPPLSASSLCCRFELSVDTANPFFSKGIAFLICRCSGLRRVFSSALMWLQEVWTFLR